MGDCIFCKIVKGDIPSSMLLEGKNFYSFLDIGPVSKGHALVVPKEHYETLTDIPDDVLAEMSKAVKTISNAINKAMNADGYNIQMNNYSAAGQVVPHAHFHIVPRFKGDGLMLWPGKRYEEGELDKIHEKIARFL